MNEDEATITKERATLTNSYYDTAKTIPLVFHFDACSFPSVEERLSRCCVERQLVEGKDLYTMDNFFSQKHSSEIREFARTASFTRKIYAIRESQEQGEEPARAMDNREKWQFFANPPGAIKELFKLFATIAFKIDADVATLPWDLCDATDSVPAVATNKLEMLSKKSMELGKHKDYDTEKGIAFGIPILYAKERTFFPSRFVNGEEGKPLLITVMLYVTAENFVPEYGLGTVFYNDNGQRVTRADCRHMRLVLFEGDIIHSVEQSIFSEGTATWRVSFVFKLSINPKSEHASVKKNLCKLMGL